MKNGLVKCLIAAACLATTIFACKSVAKKVPVAQVTDSVYYAGAVKAEQIKHRFIIKSVGTADLKIDTVVASCDCMTVDFSRKPIKYGQTGFIDVIVKPNFERKGNWQKSFLVKTNSSKKFALYRILYTI